MTLAVIIISIVVLIPAISAGWFAANCLGEALVLSKGWRIFIGVMVGLLVVVAAFS